MKTKNFLSEMKQGLATEAIETLIKQAVEFGTAEQIIYLDDINTIKVIADYNAKVLTIGDKVFEVFNDWLNKRDAVQALAQII